MAEVRGLTRNEWFLPAVAVALWWTVRMGMLGRVSFETAVAAGSLVNFGLLLAMAVVSDFMSKPGDDFGTRFKRNLKRPFLYACAAAIGVGAFHHGVAAEQTALRKLQHERLIEQTLSDDAAYAELQAGDPQLAQLDRETARNRALDSLRFQFDPRWHITASLIVLVATAASCALFATLIGGFLRS